MKKTDTQNQTQQNKDKLYQGTQGSPQEHSKRRNPASNQREFHGDVIRHGQPTHTGGTEEIPRTAKIKNMRKHKNK
jgi:hypothetical protein